MTGPDRPKWNLAKFWEGRRGTAVQTDWRVVMVRLARRDGRFLTGRTGSLISLSSGEAREEVRLSCPNRLAGGNGQVF